MSQKTGTGARPAKADKAPPGAASSGGPDAGANEGEGSQTGARHYNEATRDFVKSGKVKQAAADAARAADGPEGKTPRDAEAEGKRHSHGEDPAPRKSGRA